MPTSPSRSEPLTLSLNQRLTWGEAFIFPQRTPPNICPLGSSFSTHPHSSVRAAFSLSPRNLLNAGPVPSSQMTGERYVELTLSPGLCSSSHCSIFSRATDTFFVYFQDKSVGEMRQFSKCTVTQSRFLRQLEAAWSNAYDVQGHARLSLEIWESLSK